MTSYCITFSSSSARIKFCFPRISPTAKAGKMRRWKSSNGRIFPKHKRKSCCTITRCGFSASRSFNWLLTRFCSLQLLAQRFQRRRDRHKLFVIETNRFLLLQPVAGEVADYEFLRTDHSGRPECLGGGDRSGSRGFSKNSREPCRQ